MARGTSAAKPPRWLRLAKWGIFAVGNAFVAVSLKQILTAWGITDRIGAKGGGWLKEHEELALWMFAFAVSLTITGLLLWLLSLRTVRADEDGGAPRPPRKHLQRGELRAHYLRQPRKDSERRLRASIN